MADTTWGVKVPDELKERCASALQESGLTGKEFMESLLQIYALNQLKDSKPTIAGDIEELQSLTNRINDIYLNIGQRIENLFKDKEAEYQQNLESKNSSLLLFDSKIKDLEREKDTLADKVKQLQEENNEIANAKQSINDLVNTQTVLVNEYKDKNDMLTTMLKEYKGYKADYDTIKGNLDSERDKKIEIEARLRDALENFKILEQKIRDLEAQHKIDIDNMKYKAELDMGKAIYDVKVECQAKLDKLHNQINLAGEEYSNKVKSLLETIEELQRKLYETEPKKAKPQASKNAKKTET